MMFRAVLSLLAAGLVLGGCGGGGSSSARPNQAPRLGAVGDVTMDANAQTTVSLAVADDRTAVDNLALAVANDNALLFPDGAIVIGDAPDGAALTLTPVPDRVGAASVTVTVSDPEGASASTVFGVAVNVLQRNAASFGRDLASLDDDAEPVLINAVEFSDLGDEEDFSDLLP